MKPFIDSQDLATRFNEEEAVWREYKSLRGLRHRFRQCAGIPDNLRDRIDWLTVERSHRVVRYIGRVLP